MDMDESPKLDRAVTRRALVQLLYAGLVFLVRKRSAQIKAHTTARMWGITRCGGMLLYVSSRSRWTADTLSSVGVYQPTLLSRLPIRSSSSVAWAHAPGVDMAAGQWGIAEQQDVVILHRKISRGSHCFSS